MITSAGGTWLALLLCGLQAVLTTGTVTLVTSGVQTFTASLVSAVPADQAQLAVLNIDDAGVSTRLAQEVRREIDAPEDFGYRQVEAPTSAQDGPVVVVETPRQAADVLGLRKLDPQAEEGLRQGGALRALQAPEGELSVVDPHAADPTRVSARLATFPVIVVEGAQGSLAQGGAVILASTAARLPAPVSREVAHVFPRLTPEQQALAARLPQELHVNPDWMDLPKPPDTMPIPPAVTCGAAVLSAVDSALGVLTVTALQGVPLDLHVPWTLVGIMAGGTVLAFVGALWLALRNLSVRERME
ncbi:hypothetical protein KW076_02840 [Micrococcus porci]|uniref:hypothetical protein n=1 Tax=Micrococcus porci TaxID=2856555 RepID=UPI001CCA49D6|nr:hypothetical protein [Micrococcus porci]UBH25929.1 hypothetical protein KW076_02840 [Micrococcus porci]